MRIILASILCFILFTNHINAQENKIEWGPEVKFYPTNSFIGDDERYLYLQNSVNANFHKKKHSILKFDKRSKELVDKIEFKKNLKPYKHIMDLQLKGGNFEAVSH